MKTVFGSMVVATFLVLGVSSAAAQGGIGNGWGVGAAAGLGAAPSGLSAAYTADRWHAEGLLSAQGSGTTTFGIGGRGWFHVHRAALADFSVGGGLSVQRWNSRSGRDNDRDTTGHLDAGIQLRAFIVPNVAVSGTGGLDIVFPLAGERDGFSLTGQTFGSIGVHYYFF